MPEGTVMGFDFGTVRIGVAVGETITGLAHPLTLIASEPLAQRFEKIGALLAEWQPNQIVVGLPAAWTIQSARGLGGRTSEFGRS
jgi:putative Holliday junction resolvase